MVEFEKIKKYLDLNQDSFDNYPDIKVIYDGLIAKFENYCNRKFYFDLYTEERLFFNTDDKMYLQATPIKSIKSVYKNDILITDYKNLKNYIKINILPEDFIKVKYLGGYDEIPEDIQRAFLYQLSYEYNRKDNLGANSKNINGDNISYPEFNLLKEVKETLSKYKNFGLLL